MTNQLKTEWELRADLEAEERRARQIRSADDEATLRGVVARADWSEVVRND